MLRTFETCHRPFLAVRTPRLFKAIASPDPPSKDWNIGPLGHLDAQRIVATCCQVIPFERTTDPARLYADNRVILGIERRVAAKDLGRYRISLYAAGAPGQRFFDDAGQKLPRPVGHFEIGTGSNPVELGADFVFA
ncbi:hypothetical protein MesoLj131a_57150 [Mesorhizobium sp. 131-2-1]|nr:hypothetical protein MesoLj131a_57150 [Mesorhizobium sp. 131-2-1]